MIYLGLLQNKNYYIINKVLNQSDDVKNLLIVIRILLIVFLVGCSSKIDYVGELVNDKPHGKGTITYENGDSYEGEWKEGKKHGKGTLTTSAGGKYEGEWKDDEMEGQGTYTWPNGDKYVGGWKEGKKHGQGTLFFDDGSKAVGVFREDSPWDTTLYD